MLLRKASFKVTAVEVSPFVERPRAPFTTSTLQQEANRKLGFTAKRTMQAAQRCMKTATSLTCVPTAPRSARKLSRLRASSFAPNMARIICTARCESIRQSQERSRSSRSYSTCRYSVPFALFAARELDGDQFRLFELIWKRTIACQMADARKKRVSVTIEGGGATFVASGTASSSKVSCELMSKAAMIPKLSWQTRRPSCPTCRSLIR